MKFRIRTVLTLEQEYACKDLSFYYLISIAVIDSDNFQIGLIQVQCAHSHTFHTFTTLNLNKKEEEKRCKRDRICEIHMRFLAMHVYTSLHLNLNRI